MWNSIYKFRRIINLLLRIILLNHCYWLLITIAIIINIIILVIVIVIITIIIIFDHQ